jgi:hypothetical protein
LTDFIDSRYAASVRPYDSVARMWQAFLNGKDDHEKANWWDWLACVTYILGQGVAAPDDQFTPEWTTFRARIFQPLGADGHPRGVKPSRVTPIAQCICVSRQHMISTRWKDFETTVLRAAKGPGNNAVASRLEAVKEMLQEPYLDEVFHKFAFRAVGDVWHAMQDLLATLASLEMKLGAPNERLMALRNKFQVLQHPTDAVLKDFTSDVARILQDDQTILLDSDEAREWPWSWLQPLSFTGQFEQLELTKRKYPPPAQFTSATARQLDKSWSNAVRSDLSARLQDHAFEIDIDNSVPRFTSAVVRQLGAPWTDAVRSDLVERLRSFELDVAQRCATAADFRDVFRAGSAWLYLVILGLGRQYSDSLERNRKAWQSVAKSWSKAGADLLDMVRLRELCETAYVDPEMRELTTQWLQQKNADVFALRGEKRPPLVDSGNLQLVLDIRSANSDFERQYLPRLDTLYRRWARKQDRALAKICDIIRPHDAEATVDVERVEQANIQFILQVLLFAGVSVTEFHSFMEAWYAASGREFVISALIPNDTRFVQPMRTLASLTGWSAVDFAGSNGATSQVIKENRLTGDNAPFKYRDLRNLAFKVAAVTQSSDRDHGRDVLDLPNQTRVHVGPKVMPSVVAEATRLYPSFWGVDVDFVFDMAWATWASLNADVEQIGDTMQCNLPRLVSRS